MPCILRSRGRVGPRELSDRFVVVGGIPNCGDIVLLDQRHVAPSSLRDFVAMSGASAVMRVSHSTPPGGLIARQIRKRIDVSDGRCGGFIP